MKYKCGTLVNPQYTYLAKGKRILRVTFYGFPAMYKKISRKQEPPPKHLTNGMAKEENRAFPLPCHSFTPPLNSSQVLPLGNASGKSFLFSFALLSLIRTFGYAESTFARTCKVKTLSFALHVARLFVPLHHDSGTGEAKGAAAEGI